MTTDVVMEEAVPGPTIPASAETLLRFQPGRALDEPEKPDAPVYLLAAPSDKMLRAYRAGLQSRGIRNPTDDEMVGAIAVAIERAKQTQGLSDEVYQWHRSIIEQYRALPPYDVEKDGPKSHERFVAEHALNQLAEMLGEEGDGDHFVRKLRAKRQTYALDSLRVACAVALRGWENHEGAVEVIGHEASAATLALLDEDEQQVIGLYWFSQRHLTPDQKKTSDSPPPSPTTPPTIPASGDTRPNSTDGSRASRRSKGTRSGTKPTTSTLAT